MNVCDFMLVVVRLKYYLLHPHCFHGYSAPTRQLILRWPGTTPMIMCLSLPPSGPTTSRTTKRRWCDVSGTSVTFEGLGAACGEPLGGLGSECPLVKAIKTAGILYVCSWVVWFPRSPSICKNSEVLQMAISVSVWWLPHQCQ